MISEHKRTSVQRLFEAQSRGEQAAVADVRTPAEFAALHGVGSRCHPLDALDPDSVIASYGIPGLGSDVPLFVTCQSGQRAEMAVKRFVAAGYPNVVLVEGGVQAWESAKLPVARGKSRRVMPLPQQVQIAVGSLLIVKTLLGATIHPAFFALTAALGVGLIYAGLTQNCALAQMLSRMPWNRARATTSVA